MHFFFFIAVTKHNNRINSYIFEATDRHIRKIFK